MSLGSLYKTYVQERKVTQSDKAHHAGNTTLSPNVGWHALKCHDRTGTSLFGDPRLVEES